MERKCTTCERVLKQAITYILPIVVAVIVGSAAAVILLAIR